MYCAKNIKWAHKMKYHWIGLGHYARNRKSCVKVIDSVLLQLCSVKLHIMIIAYKMTSSLFIEPLTTCEIGADWEAGRRNQQVFICKGLPFLTINHLWRSHTKPPCLESWYCRNWGHACHAHIGMRQHAALRAARRGWIAWRHVQETLACVAHVKPHASMAS